MVAAPLAPPAEVRQALVFRLALRASFRSLRHRRRISVVLAVAAAVLNVITVDEGSAQLPAASTDALGKEPLQLVVDYGGGNRKIRESRDGIVETVGVPMGQQVTITLQFLRKRAGDKIGISTLDSGTVDLQQPATIAADGSIVFGFQPGANVGLHRLVVNGGQQYLIRLYAFDPGDPPIRPGH